MKIKELELSILLKKDIPLKDLPEKLSQGLNMYFLADEETKTFHEENKLKLYSYSLLSPVSMTKMYYTGEIYSFKLRFFDTKIFGKIKDEFTKRENNIFTIISIFEKDLLFDQELKGIYSLTSAVLIEDRRCWTINPDRMDFLKERIISNTIKKFNIINDSSLVTHDFIEKIEILNKSLVPLCFNYKGGAILGNKFRIIIKDDLLSKQLGYTLLGAGLLEKNSLSFGFCEEV